MNEKKIAAFAVAGVLLAIASFSTPYVLHKASEKQQNQHAQLVVLLKPYGSTGKDLRRSGTMCDLIFDANHYHLAEVSDRIWALNLPKEPRHQLLKKTIEASSSTGQAAIDVTTKSDYTLPFDVTYPAVPEVNLPAVHYHLELTDLTEEGKPANERARQIFAAAHRK